MKVIETRKLTKNYGKARGITELDLSVEAGDFFGFIGPNGAGKSTTIRTLLGLIGATSGKAWLFGQEVEQKTAVSKEAGRAGRRAAGKPREELLARIGYLPSEAMFYSGMRVGELLRFSAGLRKQDCQAEAKRLCERLQLDPARRIEELSLGNRKKVGIICALQHRPELYILDEPTSGLDPLMQREFFALLTERSREGATVFLSSHVLSEIKRYCSRAAIIREGRLIACDEVAALSRTGARRVAFHGQADLSGLTGIRDLQRVQESVSFLYDGAIQALLQVLSGAPLTDLTIAEPDLEEVFLHYYDEKGGKQI